jgi:hypothetical protein
MRQRGKIIGRRDGDREERGWMEERDRAIDISWVDYPYPVTSSIVDSAPIYIKVVKI